MFAYNYASHTSRTTAIGSASCSDDDVVRGTAEVHRAYYSSAPSTPAAAATAAATASLLTLDHSAAYARSNSAKGRVQGLGGVTGYGLCPRSVRPPAPSASEAASSSCLLPNTTQVFGLAGVGCIPHLSATLPPRRTLGSRMPAAPSASAQVGVAARPHLNNFVSGAHLGVSRNARTASAPPPRTETAALAGEAATRTDALRQRQAEKNSSPAKRARSSSPTPSPSTGSSADAPADGAAAATTTGPAVQSFLRSRQPAKQREGASRSAPAAAAAPSHAGDVPRTHPSTFTRHPAAALGQRAARQRTPGARMTRSSTLSRPVLLTKDASRAHNGAATASATRTAAEAAMFRAASAGPPPASHAGCGSPAPPSRSASRHGVHREGSEEAASGTAAAAAAAAAVLSSPYLARPFPPSPPPMRSGLHRRSRHGSLMSLASNSSASLMHHDAQCSPDGETAATLHFFSSMPHLSAGLREAEEATAHCSSSDDDVTMGATASALDGTGELQPPPAGVAAAAAATSRAEAPGAAGSPMYGAKRGGVGAGSVPPSPHRQSAAGTPTSVHGANASVVERLKERGNACLVKEEFGHAIASYTEAIRLAPRYEALWGNRASAFLLTFRYLPAMADCLYLLHLHPGHPKACWRAAKAYAAAYRLLEAKKYYQLAQQGFEKEGAGHGAACDAARHRPSLSSVRPEGAGEPAAGRCENAFAKTQRDLHAIAAEAAALEVVESFWQDLRHERWAAAVAAMDKVLASASYAGPTAVSWQALRLEALLHLEPKKALADAEALHQTYPDCLELYPVMTKAVFYTMHDAAATQRCLALLDEAAEKRHAQNRMLKAHLRYCAAQLRDGLPGAAGHGAALQMEEWGKQHHLREDSRITELRHTIEKFARYRDAGNAAYAAGDWDAAASAYTRCLETDRLNHALLAAVYCNRTAVYMQAGRWRDALGDADAAVSLSPQHATAYGRRGRVQLYLLAQEYEGQRAVLTNRYTGQWTAAVKDRLRSYADAAVTDLTRAVELAPTTEHKTQLQQALTQRQTILTALAPSSESVKSTKPSSAPPDAGWTRTQNPRASGSSSSSSAPPPRTDVRRATSAAVREVMGQLQLLGLSIVAPSAPGEYGRLPEPKVIAKAYREAALRWHPDKWVTATQQEQQEAERHFKSICIAYQALRERSGAVF